MPGADFNPPARDTFLKLWKRTAFSVAPGSGSKESLAAIRGADKVTTRFRPQCKNPIRTNARTL